MDYTPYSLLIDVGWISLLMIIGNLLRRKVPLFQKLLLPASITAGLLGLFFGPQVLGVINFSDQIGTYTGILIAFVFASMAYGRTSPPPCAPVPARCGRTPPACSWASGVCSSSSVSSCSSLSSAPRTGSA